MKCRLLPNNGALEVITPFDYGFIASLKQTVPASERAYNGNSKRWTVSAQYGDAVAKLIRTYFGEVVNVPQINTKTILGIIEILYLGATKDRGNGIRTASGWTLESASDTPFVYGWNVVIPEKVLKAYFDPSYTEQINERPSTSTYYETLGIKRTATADEVKTGYRRMVKQWHPDVCKDPDAHEIFISIQRAFEVLNNPKTKARYDVGLKLAETVKPDQRTEPKINRILPYRAPLKCGNLLCEYTLLGVRKTVTRILQWEDIYNAAGQVLVSSWVMGNDEPTLDWR